MPYGYGASQGPGPGGQSSDRGGSLEGRGRDTYSPDTGSDYGQFARRQSQVQREKEMQQRDAGQAELEKFQRKKRTNVQNLIDRTREGIFGTSNINKTQSGIDLWTLFKAARSGYKYNPAMHGLQSILSKLGKQKQRTIDQLSSIDWSRFNPIGSASAEELTKEDMDKLGFTYKNPAWGSPKFTDPIGSVAQNYYDFAKEHSGKYSNKSPSQIMADANLFGKSIGAPTKEQMGTLSEHLPKFMTTAEDYNIQKSPLELYTPKAHGGRVGFSEGGIVSLWQELSNL